MPELPEVQTIVEDLRTSEIFGLPILRLVTDWPSMLETGSEAEFEKGLGGTGSNGWIDGGSLLFSN